MSYPHTVLVNRGADTTNGKPTWYWHCGCGKHLGDYADESLCRAEGLAHQQEHTRAYEAKVAERLREAEPIERREKLHKLLDAMLDFKKVTADGNEREIVAILSTGLVQVKRDINGSFIFGPDGIEVV